MICPVNGKPCDKPKVVHISEYINGEFKDMFLCEGCSASYFATPLTLPNENNLLNLLDLIKSIEPDIKSTNPDKVCSCGWTLNSLISDQRLGCPKCYEVFDEEIAQLTDKIQESHQHNGKIPFNSIKKEYSMKKKIKTTLESSYRTIKRLLDDAVEKEEYEQACFYRDETIKLQKAIEEKNKLDIELKEAIKKENYEEAKKLDKMINELLEKFVISEV